jgi:excisionase family DNA binding protein
VLSVADAVALTPFSRKTILRALVARELVGSKVRNRWLIRPEDLDAWLDSGRRGSASKTAPRPVRPPSAGSVERLRAIEEAA